MTYFAFLKGVNVGGNNIINMAELKAMFESSGFKNVRTFIQSGNVAFESEANSEAIKKKIESSIKKTFGFDICVVVRTKPEMEKIIKEYPFSKVKGHLEFKVNVAFLDNTPGKPESNELEALNSDIEMFHVKGNNVYQICRISTVDSLMGKNFIEKKLKLKATVRNWNTVNKILTI